MIVSGGTFCLPAILLKEAGIRKCSMPFDWLFCDVQSLIWIIQSEFKYFLDLENISSISKLTERSSAVNKHYDNGNISRPFFNHKDPTILEDRLYYERCIQRFMGLRGQKSHLFIIDESSNIEILYDTLTASLEKHMSGMKVFAVRHFVSQEMPSIQLKRSGNGHTLIDFYASKVMNGTSFARVSDSEYLLNNMKKNIVF